MKIRRQYFADIIASLYVLLLVYAAVSKLMDTEKFRVQLDQSILLTHFASVLVWLVPMSELLIAVTLIVPSFRLAGLFAAFGIMVLFTGYVIAITRFTVNVPCSCGGVLEKMTWNQHLIFNLAFLTVGGFGILFYPVTTGIVDADVESLSQRRYR